MKKINSIQNNEVLNKSELYNQSSDPINKMLQESYAYEKIFPGKDSEKEIGKILEVIQILNSMVPITFPQYNFNPDEINGEYYYKPDGILLLIREYEKDIIRDYYYDKDNNTISRIQEHDKNNGRIKAKIDPAKKKNKNEISDDGVVELNGEEDSYPSTLSGGMKMRLSLARALRYNGDLFLMDEPFSALDENMKNRIIPRVFDLLKNKTVLIISHDQDEASKYADKIINI